MKRMAEDSFSLPQEKKRIRSLMAERRRNLPEGERAEKSRLIVEHLLKEPALRSAKTLMAYIPMKEEIELFPLLEKLLKTGVALAIPHIVGKGIMEAVYLPTLQDLIPGEYGIPTVREEICRPIRPEAIDCIIAPGVAFTKRGDRLGMGGGFYDRFFEKATRAYKIGAAYGFQILDELPAEAHDISMDSMITESGLLR